MTKTRWGVLVVAMFTVIILSEGIAVPLVGQSVNETVKPTSRKKPKASRHASKEEEARRRLMSELYQLAITPMPLRAGRAALLFAHLMADDEARRIEAIERLRPRRTPRGGPVPVLIATHGELNAGRPGS